MDQFFFQLIAGAGAVMFAAFVVALLLARWRMGKPRTLGYVVDCLVLLLLILPDELLWSVVTKLNPVPLQPDKSLPDPALWWFVIVLTFSIFPLPIFYIAARCAFSRVGRDLVDAARTLGMGSWGILWRVMIPAGWPWLLGGFVLGFLRACSEFSYNVTSLWVLRALTAIFAFGLLLQLPKRAD